VTEINISVEETIAQDMQLKEDLEPKRISNLPKITSLLLPAEYELLPNISELFELEFAFYEYKFLTKREIIHRGAFFKSIDGMPTNHYLICSSSTPLIWQGRSEITRAYFKEGNFSTGYATHGLFPYRGKFHPQLIKGLLNILSVQPGEIVLDPMCGSGTLNVEAAIIGIDSIGIERSPFCILMSKAKHESLKADGTKLSAIISNAGRNYKILAKNKKLPAEFSFEDNFSPEKIGANIRSCGN